MRIITLPIFCIIVQLNGTSGSISSSLHYYNDGEEENDELYNSAMDAIESMILAHACAGIDIESPAYLEGVETAVISCANNL